MRWSLEIQELIAERLHADRCREPGCLARSREMYEATIALATIADAGLLMPPPIDRSASAEAIDLLRTWLYSPDGAGIADQAVLVAVAKLVLDQASASPSEQAEAASPLNDRPGGAA